MPAFKDLTGQRFGRLVVKNKLPERKNNKIMWHCICDCGAEKDIMGSQLTKTTQPTRSCGCLQKERSREVNQSPDLTGKKYGRLIVLRRIPQTSLWECQCECGNVIATNTNHLNQGHTQSCGCLQKDITFERSFINLTGKKIGLLTVLGLDIENSSPKKLKYKCQCDCGNTCSVLAKNLHNQNTQSCGCLRISHGELRIRELLQEYNIPFETEKTFDTCINPRTQKKLRFDFFVNKQYLIEFDGKQHYQENYGWDEELADIQYRDNIKTEWCKKNNIPLIRIPYTKDKTLSINDLLLPIDKDK